MQLGAVSIDYQLFPKTGSVQLIFFVFKIKTQQNGLIWVQCLLTQLQLNFPGLHFHVHQYLVSYQTLQVKKKFYLRKGSNLGKHTSVSLISETGEFAEMTTKIRANRLLAEHTMTGKQELFLYLTDLENVFEEANNIKCQGKLTPPRLESGKGKNKFEFQPLGKGDHKKNPTS